MHSKYIWPQAKCPSPIYLWIASIIFSYDSYTIPTICSLKKLYNNPCACAFIDYVSLFPEQTDYVVHICKSFTTLKGTIKHWSPNIFCQVIEDLLKLLIVAPCLSHVHPVKERGYNNEPEMGECLQLGDSPAYQQLKGLQVYFVPFHWNLPYNGCRYAVQSLIHNNGSSVPYWPAKIAINIFENLDLNVFKH